VGERGPHGPERTEQLTSTVRANASGSIIAIGPKVAMPALAHTTSSPPSPATARSVASCIASRSATSAVIACA
jgi:hypothetical protein